MTGKSLQERYADVDLRRMVEHPGDELEEEYAHGEAMQQAKAIWDRFGKNENYRRRVITLLAQEALKGMPAHSKQVAEEGLLDE